MSTNSTISVEVGDKIFTVYCHFDGYPKGVGKTLFEHYNFIKTVELVSFGDMSSLGKNISPTNSIHSHDAPETDVCVFYHRDRNEDFNDTRADISDVGSLDYMTQEYNYLLKDDVWYVKKESDGELKLLSKVLGA